LDNNNKITKFFQIFVGTCTIQIYYLTIKLLNSAIMIPEEFAVGKVNEYTGAIINR